MFPKNIFGSRFNSSAGVANVVINASDIVILAGQTTITLTNVPFNIRFISASDAENIDQILAGRDGYILIIVALDNNITISDNAFISLNSLPDGTNFSMQQYDVLALINRDGDPNNGINGSHQELFRTEKS